MHDLRILNGTVVTGGEQRPLDVGIENGQVVEVEETGRIGAARFEIDASGTHVLPGAIDVHFHCKAPSKLKGVDFASETRAAAAGGVTTVCEMPISSIGCHTPELFDQRRELGEKQAYVNFALYSGAALSPAKAAEMAEVGAIGFKLFTIKPPTEREREFEGLWATDEGAIYEALSAVASTGLRCVVHAENDRLVRHFGDWRDESGVPYRPPVIEAAAIGLVATLASEAGASIHIAHVTSDAALAAVEAAKRSQVTISAETCPQYLALNSGSIKQHGALARVGPPLREPDDQSALWSALRDGTISLVASDHSPFPVDQKRDVEYAVAPQGLPTVELLVPVLLDAVVRGHLEIGQAVSLITSVPAELFGLSPRKGAIVPGADADIVIVRLGTEFRPGPETLLSRGAGCGIVFSDLVLQARVEKTVVNGRLVYDRGEIVASAGGRFTTAA